MKARNAGVAIGGWDWTEETVEEVVVVGWEFEIGSTAGDGAAIFVQILEEI